MKGPGTHLKELLLAWGFAPQDCDCEERRRLMDEWGPEGCRENFELIAFWLEESAKSRGMQAYLMAGGHRWLIGVAIRRSERERRRSARLSSQESPNDPSQPPGGVPAVGGDGGQ